MVYLKQQISAAEKLRSKNICLMVCKIEVERKITIIYFVSECSKSIVQNEIVRLKQRVGYF